MAVNYLFLAVSIFCFFLCRRKWQEALFISGVLVSFLPSNWEYTLVYYLPVLFLFLKEYDMPLSGMCRAGKIWTTFHSITFALVFSVNFFMLYYRYGLVSGVFTVTYLVLFVNMVGVLWEWLRDRNRKMS